MEPQHQNTPSHHPLNMLLSNLIIYCSQYSYDATLSLLNKLIDYPDIVTKNYNIVLSVVQDLFNSYMRQTVHGPSGSYISIQDRPHQEYLDLGCIYEHNLQPINLDNIIQFMKQHKLDEIIAIDRIDQLSWYRKDVYLKKQKFIHKKLTKNILKKLQIDGQVWNRAAPLPTLLITLKFFVQKVINKLQKQYGNQLPYEYKEIYLYRARFCYFHNKILNMPSKTLYEGVVSNYRKYLNIVKSSISVKQNTRKININDYMSILLEYMHTLTFYYKYRQAQIILNHCQDLANVSFEYTGKLGRRTKYQSFDTAQLIMNFKEAKKQNNKTVQQQCDDDQKIQDDLVDIPSAFDLVKTNIEKQDRRQTLIKYSQFDQESILLEKPKINQQQSNNENVQVSQIKLLISLCSLQYKFKTTPKDQVLYQQVSSALAEMLSYGKIVSYPILFNMLFLRSQNQFNRVKNAQRALQQFQTLKQNYNIKPLNQKNSQYTLSTDYKLYLEFISHLADKYLGLGMVMTAVDLYEKVGMFQECIDGLIARQYRDKAKQKIFNILDSSNKDQQYSKISKENPNKTPRLLCMLGDANKISNPKLSLQLYQESWELSGHKFARAQRSIGWYYFSKKQFEKAAQAFKKATSISYYNPNTWFTLGCCYMNIKEYQKALPAFSESISIDNTQGQAWGNMASCYMYLNKFKQAYSTLEQSVKYSERNWKLWANLLTVSLKLQKFYKYFECVEKLVAIQRNQIVTFEVLYKIAVIFRHHQNNVARRHSILAMKNRINRLFEFFITKIGQHSKLWKAIYFFYVQLEQFIINNHHHYTKIHNQGRIQEYDNDIIAGYQKAQQIKAHTNKQLYQLYNSILDCKMTELNMVMKIGWETAKNIAQQVLLVIQEYIWVWNKYAPKVIQNDDSIQHKHNKIEHQLFVAGVKKKLQQCLERQINFVPKQI